MDLILEGHRRRCRHIAEHEHDPLRGHRQRAEHRRRRGVWKLRAFRDTGRVNSCAHILKPPYVPLLDSSVRHSVTVALTYPTR